jgi:hypothetical protein
MQPDPFGTPRSATTNRTVPCLGGVTSSSAGIPFGGALLLPFPFSVTEPRGRSDHRFRVRRYNAAQFRPRCARLSPDLPGSYHRDQQRQEQISRGFSNVHGLPRFHRLANLSTPYSQARGESHGKRRLSTSDDGKCHLQEALCRIAGAGGRPRRLRSLCRDAITNIGAIDCFVALPITAS